MRIPTGKRILSKEGVRYKEDTRNSITEQMKNQEWNYEATENHHIYMDYIFYSNRKGRDADNLHKLVQDTLKEIVYIDDHTVLTRPNRILIDRQNPRLELKIAFVRYIGVFSNYKQLDQQLSICDKCKKYRNNKCSILKDCIEGVINNNFDFKNKICSKYIKNG